MTLDVERILAQQGSGLPRYTSYPPANHFRPGGGMLLLPAMTEAARRVELVSIYIHIPFCDRMCWFCGCHTKQTLRYEPVADYVKSLASEIALWGKQLGLRPKVANLHFGGGSPSLLRDAELDLLRSALDAAFDFSDGPEISFEIDPSDVTGADLGRFARFGMTRASIGVQDFNPAVQVAINRPQSFELTRDVIEALRGAGVQSINIDALYGLPLQTAERLADTIAKVSSLAPDRVALFGYAHVPWMKPHQRLIDEATLPGAVERFEHAQMAARMIVDAGYEAIGIDHFAKPGDSLAKAAREGRLRRNFQGYTDDETTVRIGLGPSAIGCFDQGFVQNEVATGLYTTRINKAELALARGLELNEEDRLYADIIEQLMCNFGFSCARLEAKYGAAAAAAITLAKCIAAADKDGLCHISQARFEMRETARPFVRIVAARFDQWLATAGQRYSKVI
jgi:oxygen-independent coproporphyrinogen-3 oxidase